MGSSSPEADPLLQQAFEYHRQGRLRDAERLYRKLLRRAPDEPRVLRLLGVLQHQAGDLAEAERLLRRAKELDDADPDTHHNLGHVLMERAEFADAVAAYKRAAELRPDLGHTYYNLGMAHMQLDEPMPAAEAFRKVIELEPEHPQAHYYLGETLRSQERYPDAIEAYRRSLELRPTFATGYESLTMLLHRLGQIDEATEVYEQWAANIPDDPIARHMLAACSGHDVPERAPDDYVRAMFNRTADIFDDNLRKLDYRGPELIAEAVALLPAARPRFVLDLGCGTGLCGVLVRPYASRLVGVDLAEEMLKRAETREVYDRLELAEIVEFMATASAQFDLVIAADTFIYFGDLGAAFAGVRKTLRPGGWFVFTVEQLCGPGGLGYRLNPHGRYSHTADYVQTRLHAHGFEVEDVQECSLRTERRERVAGLVVIAQSSGG